MIGLVALAILAQPNNLNLNQQPVLCMDEGNYCSVTKRRAFEVNCSGAGITCTQTAGRMTLTVGGGGPGGGGAPLDGGYLTLTAGSTGSTNEVVLSAGSNINITAGGVVSVTGTVPSATTATTAATAYSADASYFAHVARVAYSADAGYYATEFIVNPSDCSAGQYATTIASNGNLTCAQVAYSQISGTPTIPADLSAEPFITKTASGNLSNEFALGTLATGLLKNTTTTGVPTIAVSGTDYAPATSGSALLLGNGAGGFSSYAGATCTNQFPRSLSSAGAATCASVSSSDLSLTTTSCTNQFVTAIAANGTGTCTTDTLASAQHANQGTTTTVLHGNAAGNPSWSAVALTADVSGTLPIANGGTNSTATPTNGGIVYGTGSAYAVTAAGTGGDCLKSGGAGAPTWGSCSSISAYSTIDDEGTPLTQRTTLNFTGPAITCSDDGAETDCDVAAPKVQTARLTGDYTNNSTTGTEVTGLQVSLSGASTVLAEYTLMVQSAATTTGYKFGVNYTGSLTTLKCTATHPTTGTTAATGVGDDVAATNTGNIYEVLGTATTASTTAPNLGPNAGVTVINTNVQVEVRCIAVVGGSGDLELWAGSEVAASQITVKANSIALVTTIP